MSIRIEWLDEEKTILCYTPLASWTWRDNQRLIEELLPTMLIDAPQEIALVADLRQSRYFGLDMEMLLKALNDLMRDTLAAKALAIVGLPYSPSAPDIISANSLVDAANRLRLMLSEKLSLA